MTKEEKTGKNRISGISESSSGKDQNVKVDLKNGLKKKLPENFNVNDIGNIDLREAEKIANEDILFLTENDLIAGLEDFDLIPLKEEMPSSYDEPDTRKTEKERQIKPLQEKYAERTASPSDSVTVEDNSATTEEREQAIIDSILSEERGTETEIAGEERVTLPDDVKENEPEEVEEKTAPFSDEIVDDIDLGEIVEFSEPDFASLSEEDFIEMPVKEPEEEKDHFPREVAEEIPVAEEISDIKEIDVTEELPVSEEGRGDEYTREQIREIGSGDGRVRFIDDGSFETDAASASEFDESELEKISVDIGDVIEGKSIILTEAESEDESRLVATLISEERDSYSDLVIDFEDAEYRYRDTELDIIDSSIIDEDYSDYIKKIDDYYSAEDSAGSQKMSSSMELFGLSDHEMSGIEDHLFQDEYKGVDIDAEVDLFRVDFGPIDLSETREKNYRYISPYREELEDAVKLSIEEDLTSDNALIFEEDIDEIEKLLGREVDDPKKPAAIKIDETGPKEVVETEKPLDDTEDTLHEFESDDEIVISDSDLEIIVEDFFDEMAPEDSATRDDKPLADSVHEEIFDITDKIIILEDDLDIDRFIKKFPEEKQDNLKKLLKYLDGLFEKLPESTIKSFADSEYYDLYTKVLDDMGIS
jgi:hypothetical protein